MESATAGRHFPDRDRLSVVTAVILLAYALARFVDLPTRQIGITLLGSSLGIELNGQAIILLMVAALISTGSDTVIRSHPRAGQGLAVTAIHWILPGLTALALGLVLNLPAPGPIWWLGLAFSALFLIIVLIAEYTVVDRDDPGFQVAALGLTVLSYLVALALFGWIRYTGTRAALSATSTAALSGLLSLRLLILSGAAFRRSVFHAATVGLVCGEAMWALNYWRASSFGAGLILLVLFYILHGVAQQHSAGQMTRRVLVEFAVVGLIGVAIGLGLAVPR